MSRDVTRQAPRPERVDATLVLLARKMIDAGFSRRAILSELRWLRREALTHDYCGRPLR